jgi:hypothetical protein
MHRSQKTGTSFAEQGWLPNTGRRAASRLRLSIPMRLVTLSDTRRCILVNLSRTGALIGLERPLKEGNGAILKFADIEQFGVVVRFREREAGGLNGFEFDVLLKDSDVLAIRRYAESFEDHDRRALRSEVQSWVTGGK